MALFGFTLGAVCWVYVAEMLNSRQLQVVIAVHWLLASLNMFAFPLLPEKVVPGILLATCLVLSVLHRWYLIETKNKSTLEIIRSIDAF